MDLSTRTPSGFVFFIHNVALPNQGENAVCACLFIRPSVGFFCVSAISGQMW